LASIRDTSFTHIPGRAAESVDEHDSLLRLINGGATEAEVEAAAREHRLATLRAFLARGARGARGARDARDARGAHTEEDRA
jgi:hypothetical protein